MRKDVKFGLTVGAILLATLAVYVIVLSRGGSGSPGNPDVSIATPTDSDTAAPPADNSTPAPVAAPADKPAPVASGPDFGASTVTPPATPALDSSTPATQPSSVSDASTSSTDWNYALNHGQVKLMSAGAPERTETPTIDRTTAAARPAQVGSDVHPALIDGPATQPSDQSTIVTPPTLSAPIAMPAPASPASPSSAVGQRTHVIARGETLSAIAAAVYGNSRYYTRILAANPGVDPRHLKIGATLVIPEVAQGERSESSGSASASSSSTPAVDPAKGYTVVAGDSLEKIAVRLYGDTHMQDKIYDLNRGLIGPDENRLKIGWVLKLPQPPTATAGVTAAAHQ